MGLVRNKSIAHDGWQIGPGGYASNGITTQVAAEIPWGVQRIYSTANGVFAMRVVSGEMTLLRSADGIAAYAQVWTATTGRMNAYLPLLVDCGSDRLVIFQYGDDEPDYLNESKVWASTDGGDNWSELFTAYAGSIRHFHGGYYDSDSSTLFVFTGDNDPQCSILLCADVDDLIANPTTWQARWGLTDAERTQLDEDYALGSGSQAFRTVYAIAKDGYLYWGSDTYGYEGGVTMSRANIATRVVESIYVREHSPAADPGKAVGEVWTCGAAADGTLLFSTQAHPSDDTYLGDDEMHLYAIEDSGLFAREILSIPRNNRVALLPQSIHTIAGYTVLSFYYDWCSPLAGCVPTLMSQ